jgi:filamentous hemagglutinin
LLILLILLILIEMGARKIDGYTWHHHQDNGRMQLIPEMVHKKTGHIGGEAIGGM